jgi:hypothetical protein
MMASSARRVRDAPVTNEAETTRSDDLGDIRDAPRPCKFLDEGPYGLRGHD